MIAAHGACERTLEQFQAIFQDASEKLHYKGVTRGPDGSFFSLVDFVYSG
jgi:6-hydroxytryprostatin B O-methyltransferase